MRNPNWLKLEFCCNFFKFFVDTVTSNNIPYRVISCNLSFIFDHPYARQLNILTNRTTALGMLSAMILDNINLDVTPYGMLLDVYITKEKKKIKDKQQTSNLK